MPENRSRTGSIVRPQGDDLTVESILEKRKQSLRNKLGSGSHYHGKGYICEIFNKNAETAVGCAVDIMENIYINCSLCQKLRIERGPSWGTSNTLVNRLGDFISCSVFHAMNSLVRHMIDVDCPQAAGHYQLHAYLRETECLLVESRRLLWRIGHRSTVKRYMNRKKERASLQQKIGDLKNVVDRILEMIDRNCLMAYAEALKQRDAKQESLLIEYLQPGVNDIQQRLSGRYTVRCAFKEFCMDFRDLRTEFRSEQRFLEENDARVFSIMLAESGFDGTEDLYTF